MGLRVANEIKQPNEERRYGIDFSVEGGLADGDSIIIGTTTAKIYDSTGVDLSATMIKTGTLQLVGEEVSVMVKGGTSGQEYKLTFLVTTLATEVLEEDLIIPVEAL